MVHISKADFINFTKSGQIKEVVEALRADKSFVDAADSHGISGLMWASKNGHDVLVSMLLNYNVLVNVKDNRQGNTALIFAAQNGFDIIVKNLIANGADVNAINKAGNNALILAVNNGHETIVRYLIQNKTELDLIGSYGNTALTDAASKGCEVIVNMLVTNSADVNARGFYDSNTALILAAREGHELIVNMLILYNADLNMKDDWGYSALISASRNGHASIVDILLGLNADVNISNNDGDTAIMEASTVEVAYSLVIHNADLNVRNNYKRNAAYYLRDRLGEDVLLTLNFLLRRNFLSFLQGCDPLATQFADLHHVPPLGNLSKCVVSEDETSQVSTGILKPLHHPGRCLIRCFEDPYWIRSVLEFIFVLPQ